MRSAIITVTKAGTRLAIRLAAKMEADIFAKYPAETEHYDIRQFENLGQLAARLFAEYDELIFIMAVGIVARVTAPHIRDKRTDPAIVVVDDGGNHAISFLSGHIGGANALTLKVADIIGARPVITTATDVAGKGAPDVLAVKLKAQISPFGNLKKVNAALVNGGKLAYFLDNSLPRHDEYREIASSMGITCTSLVHFCEGSDWDAAVLITDKQLSVNKLHIFLRPPTLAVGVGCRRNTDKNDILTAIRTGCNEIGRSEASIAVMASTVVKSDEQGLLAAAAELKVPLRFFENTELQHCINKYNLDTSQFVKEQIGVGNVCEASAILAADAKATILPKTKRGQVTVAIAEMK